MESARWEKLKEIFAQASELPHDERGGLLREACAGDDAMRGEIEVLLAHLDRPENLLEANAFDLTSPEPVVPGNLTSQTFGNYRILREIGVGGMGAVYLAERSDGEFRREVALKIVKRSVADAETARRFKREREILAGLEHPNIARLLDGGIAENGEAYLVMEYVNGEDLMSYVRRSDLGTNGKLRLFLKICAAVAYAHQNVTVHRDLKPSNILVSGDGEPKLLDFGLAKIVDTDVSDDATQTALRAFTPAYASPEQIAGRPVNTTSDIYSLGVVLYEMLTGNKPYRLEGKSLLEIIATVTGREPEAPSAVLTGEHRFADAGELRGDLDNITLKAMNAEPARRYRSVDEFAADIERHLSGLPVSARPNTIVYRASKFIKRNRTAVVSAFLVVTAIVVGLGVAFWQFREARIARDRAEKRFNDVRQLSNALLFEIAPKIERVEGTTEARELLVSRALVYLDGLATESRDDLGLQLELAAAYEKIGEIQGSPNRPNLSDFSGALRSFQKAENIRVGLPQTVANRLALAKNLRESAAISFVQNDNRGSLAQFERSLAIFGELSAQGQLDREAVLSFLEAKLDHAQTYSANNQHAIAVPIFRTTLSEIGSLPDNEPEKLRLTAKANALLSNALSWDGKQEEAESIAENAVALAAKLIAGPVDPESRQTAWRVYMLASSIYEGSDDKRALDYADRSRRIAQDSADSDKSDVQAKQNLAKSYSRMGSEFEKLDRAADAVASLDKARVLLEELIAREPKNRNYQNDLGKLFTRYGDARLRAGDATGALEAFRRSATIFERIADADAGNQLAKRDLAQALKSCAKIEIRLGDITNARTDLLRADEILGRLMQSGALGDFDATLVNEIKSLLSSLPANWK